MTFPRIPLYAKLTIMLVCILGVFVVVNGTLVFTGGNTIIARIRTDALSELLREKTSRINQVFHNASSLARHHASMSSATEVLQKEKDKPKLQAATTMLDTIVAHYPEVAAAYIMNAQGIAIASSDRRFVSQDYSKRMYFKAAMQSGSYIDHLVGITSNEPGYYFSNAINVNGKTMGIIVVKIKERNIKNMFIDLDQSREGTLLLIDRYGVIISSDDPRYMYKAIAPLTSDTVQQIQSEKRYPFDSTGSLNYSSLLEQIIKTNNNDEISLSALDPDRNRMHLFAHKVGIHPYYLTLVAPEQTLIDYSSLIVWNLIVSNGISFSVIFAVILFAVSVFLRPLRTIRAQVKALTGGDLSSQVHINTNDEWEDLATAFNAMTTKLKSYYQELEDSVNMRTRELTNNMSELENTKTALMNVLSDVESQKKQVEGYAQELQKFELAVKEASDHIIITDPDGLILFANASVERITGYSIAEMLGKKAGGRELWGGHEPTEKYTAFWKQIKEEKRSFVGLFENRRKNGTPYTAEARVSPVLDENHNVAFFVGIETDVTRRNEVDRMKTEFVSLASHQLKTPLTSMRWIIESLAAADAGAINPQQKELLTDLYEVNTHMIALVNDLLNISRLETGKIQIEKIPTNIRSLTTEVHVTFKTAIERRNQSCTVTIADDVPMLLSVDTKLTKEVMSNLISNAIKYTPEGGSISVELYMHSKTMWALRIKDTGCGIAPSDQNRIYEKFFRAENARKTAPDGTGLGMYVIREIVHALGGGISLNSELNRGTTFTCTFPL